MAFSPYGLSTVAVLLLEGASGHSAYQLQKILRLPWDILVTKIGFRDLHRHLKVRILIPYGSKLVNELFSHSGHL